MKEQWKDVPNYEGCYQVSNYGNVKRLGYNRLNSKGRRRIFKEKLMTSTLKSNGYYHVNLSLKGVVRTRTVHQLVAMAFLNHNPNGYNIVVDHIDDNKTNNKLSNLQLVTQRQNTTKRIRGLSKFIGVCFCKESNKWRARIDIDGKKKCLGRYTCELAAAHAYNKKLKEITL